MKLGPIVQNSINIIESEYKEMLSKKEKNEEISDEYFDNCLILLNTVLNETRKMFNSEKEIYLTIKFQNMFAIHEAYVFPKIKDEYKELLYQINLFKKIKYYLHIIEKYHDFSLLIIVTSLLHTNLCMFHNRNEILDSKTEYFVTRRNLYNKNLGCVNYYYPNIVENKSAKYKSIIEEQLNVIELIKENRKHKNHKLSLLYNDK